MAAEEWTGNHVGQGPPLSSVRARNAVRCGSPGAAQGEPGVTTRGAPTQAVRTGGNIGGAARGSLKLVASTTGRGEGPSNDNPESADDLPVPTNGVVTRGRRVSMQASLRHP